MQKLIMQIKPYFMNQYVLSTLLVSASICFIAGIFLPMLTLKKFLLFSSELSIVSGLIELIDEGHWILFLIVGVFSIVLPIVKIGLLTKILACNFHGAMGAHQKTQEKALLLMHRCGRWAMLDVFIVAVLFMSIKLGAIASVEIHMGLYMFAAGVLLIMLLTSLVVKLSAPTAEP